MMNLICFDLEGPLSPQDNAYEVMGLIPSGRKIFEVISRYDDVLAIEGKEGYEPGDTLALIVPFLIHHGITEGDIKKVSDRAYLVNGASELIARLQTKGWNRYIVSTSYEQHAYSVASRLGLPSQAVVCTTFPLDELRQEVKKEELALLSEVERHVLDKLYADELGKGIKDKQIKSYLDYFYWQELPKTTFGIANKKIEVIGGRRKVWAIERIARQHDTYFDGIVFVGDSITDAQSARVVEAAGGLSVAFNGNAFVIPYATVGVASMSLLDLEPVLDAWLAGGREKVRNIVEEMPRPRADVGPFYHWLVSKKGRALTRIFDTHKRTRGLVRAEAAKLG